MKITRITVSVIVALNIASAARAQETLKGEVVAINRASKKISIKLGGTVGQVFISARQSPDGIFGKDTGEANTSRRSCLITSPATSGP